MNLIRILNALFLSLLLLGISGCDDEEVDELIDDLFEDREYSAEVDFPPLNNALCPNWRRRQTVAIAESMKLPENCSFEQVTINITRPNVEFDCNNAVFNGMTKLSRNEFGDAYRPAESPHGIAFMIRGREGDSTPLSGITIRNCQIINYIQGIDVKLVLSAGTKAGLRAGNVDEDTLRAKAPTNVQMINSKIINPHGSGAYINRYVTSFGFIDSSIKGAGGPGLYLDAGSRSAKIDGAVLEGNGYSSYDRRTLIRSARRSKIAKREGIAVDSSTRNEITRTTFRDNGDGGIYLYKNCWEDAANDPNELPRTEGADFNRIENNAFFKETTAIWVAERADRDLTGFDCGDPLIYEVDEEKYYRDFARENVIVNNRFLDTETAIRVMDDGNAIQDNTFADSSETDVNIGSGIRQIINDPVSGTLVSGNTLSKTDGIVYSSGAQ